MQAVLAVEQLTCSSRAVIVVDDQLPQYLLYCITFYTAVLAVPQYLHYHSIVLALPQYYGQRPYAMLKALVPSITVVKQH
jgi:hypothetical protein